MPTDGRTDGPAGGVLHRTDPAAVQADETLARAAHSDSHLQGVGPGTDFAGVFSRARHRRVCQSGVLRGKVTGEFRSVDEGRDA